ncbi:MAG: sensor histidine kinase [Candidatus Heritagella sp.]
MMKLPLFRRRPRSPHRKTGVLSVRFFWYMGLVLISITVLLSVLAYFYLASGEEQENKRVMKIMVGQLSASTENTIRSMDRILVSYAASTTMKNLFDTQSADMTQVEKGKRMIAAQSFLETLTLANEDIYNIEYVLNDGEYFSTYSRYISGGQIDEAVEILSQTGDWYGFRLITPSYSQFQAGMESHTISLVRLLHTDNSDDPVGYGVISFKQKSFGDLLTQLIQENLKGDLPVKVCICSEDLVFFQSEEHQGAEQQLLQMARGVEGEESGTTELKGRQVLYEMRRNDYDGLVTMVYMDLSEAHASTWSYLLIFIGLLLVLEILVLYIWWRLTHRLLTPVTDLCTVMEGDSPTLAQEPDHMEQRPEEIQVLYKTYNRMIGEIMAWHEREIRYQENISRLEKTALSMQINPHYFYNVLSLISARADTAEDPVISRICTDLAQTMRYTIKAPDMVPLSDEKKMAEKYLRIVSLMYDRSFRVDWRIPAEYANWKVPKVVLQPLIENAMNHGGLVSREDAHLQISVSKVPSGLCLCVADNGCGMEEKQCWEINRACQQSLRDFVEEVHPSLGILSVNFRLKYHFGDRCRLRVDSSPGKGTTITMLIPGQEEEETDVHGIDY